MVPDVHGDPDHIACDPRSRSEIVVPVRSPGGRLLGVLDVDSVHLSAFGDIDARALEEIASMVGRAKGSEAPEGE